MASSKWYRQRSTVRPSEAAALQLACRTQTPPPHGEASEAETSACHGAARCAESNGSKFRSVRSSQRTEAHRGRASSRAAWQKR
eukprot:2861251-Pyramimonas_sp.AAC.1